ncbi:MAG: endonuclease MutS2 [Oscillospiraceae bacterium]|jgi:DNA mismatch repair protein MutS2|nr:endonuclease MutS2 [Oscillospiraceae bacterium]
MADALVEKSYRTLELPAVLELLAGEAVCEAAREAARALRPADSLWEAERRQRETDAAHTLIGLRGSPVFSGVRAVGLSLRRAELGGVLTPRELLDIASLLHTARTVKDYGSQDGHVKTDIDHLFAVLKANKYLEERITTVILSEEEIADIASSALADIRRHMRAVSARARETLQRIISSSAYARHLQEPIITIRSDRYVIPVKSESRGEVPGLVHDVSASGATFFIEPLPVVQMGNELRELAAKEKAEIERILAELSAQAAEHADDMENDYDALVALDLIFAKGKLSLQMDAARPALNETGEVSLREARHPLIARGQVVPVSVRLGQTFDTLIITGPNTGGKTVTLKTLGLFTLMAACGLHVPALEGSVLSRFDAVLADIGDEQSIEQSLSTFSSHMTNIVSILDRAGPSTLVLFDELGAGTDPVEGAALAVAIIQHARMLGARVAATTHYAELKAFALSTKGVENASCEFDVETLRPTYRLLIGVPGRSNAFAISRRLGLPEEVIARAGAQVGAEDASFEEVLARLEAERQAMERARQAADADRLAAEEHLRRSREARALAERAQEKTADRARAEARLILEQARMAADEVLREAKELKTRADGAMQAQEYNDARAALRRRLREADEAVSGGRAGEAPAVEKPARPVVPGDTVELPKVGTRAVVLARQGQTLTLQAGLLKVTVREDEVRLVDAPKVMWETDRDRRPAPIAPGASSPAGPRLEAAARELDLRGQAADEALLELDRFLDQAVLGGLHTVTIIHGKGTGVLRKAVQTALRGCRQVAAFRPGRYGEGEQGVTIVELK